MKLKPVVSIITPTFNHEKYIEECINSVLNQSFENWEMIIIDDGSTDTTGEIISKFQDDRITYIYQKNQGPYKLGEIYNKALSVAKGDYIAILEGDDFWPPNKLEYQLPAFNDKNVVMSYGRSKLVYEINGKREIKDVNIREINCIINNNPLGMALNGFFLIDGSSPFAVTVMLRKSTLIEIGGFQQPICIPYVDRPTELEFAIKGNFKYMKTNLGYHRRHVKSVTHNFMDGKLDNCILKYKKEFLNKNSLLIKDLNLPLEEYYNSLSKKEDLEKFLLLIQIGKELFELGEIENSKIRFQKALEMSKSQEFPIYLKIVTYLGLLSTYLRKNILGYSIKLYSAFETNYWNIKFKFKSE